MRKYKQAEGNEFKSWLRGAAAVAAWIIKCNKGSENLALLQAFGLTESGNLAKIDESDRKTIMNYLSGFSVVHIMKVNWRSNNEIGE
jgi:hypothetical protein